MTASLDHRGPDDVGHWISQYRALIGKDPVPGVALGFRRLSIIDLEGGAQPMSNEDQSVWMVFNGEIYNYRDLRRRLEGAGHQFRTASDSEAIIHLYEDLGVECFEHLNGMFAIAIWDSRANQLVLARDRIGQKPLYYRHEPNERMLFGSELKSILAAPNVPREISPTALDQYLTYQYVPHPYSIFKGIHKLSPGHVAVFKPNGAADIQPYWSLTTPARSSASVSELEAVDQLRPLLESSVKLRMQSDVPLGAFLSGGVDSSLIVALMQKNADRPVQTFNIAFTEKQYDESKYAQQVATFLGTDHQQFTITPNMLEVLPQLATHYDEPFADSSAIPTWYVSQQTRKQVTVALSGDGGDELFAGYRRYRAAAMGQSLDRMPPLRALLSSRIWQWLPGGASQRSRIRQFKRFSESLRLPAHRRYLNWISIFRESQRAGLYSDEFLERLPSIDPAQFFFDAWDRSVNRDAVTRASMADLVTYLPCDLNYKVDIASMAHGLEVRQPFLDHRVVEWAASLPSSLKYRRRRGKRILERAFKDMIPKNIWSRPKMGFGVPLDRWFRSELKPLLIETLLSEKALGRGLFRESSVRQLVDEHLDARANHDARLWALLMLELWHQRWVD